MAEPRGQGAHTLKDPKRRTIFGGWWTTLDRWGEVPRGYGIMVCGCRRIMLDNSDGGEQKWILPLHPHRGRKPVPSPTGKEGDRHVLCGVPFRRIWPKP